MDVEFGNAGRLDTSGTGWIVGFSPWTRSGNAAVADLRYMNKHALSHGISIKWMEHPAPDPAGGDRPISEGRTISILASESGRFRIKFSPDANYPAGQVREYLLTNHGDYVIWGEGIYHSWSVEVPCIIITVRWVSARPLDIDPP